MALPDASRLLSFPGAALAARFRSAGLTREFIQKTTERGDDLRAPLTPTQAASLADDTVMGAGETTAILFQAGWPDRRVRRALDLGCGAGAVALLAAAGADEVIGTDINPRAIALAGFNAVVNGIGNAAFRTGGVYAPVEREKFDVILSQPPYYPNPAGSGGKEVFLHGGLRGDELSRRVVEGLAAHLEEGGRGALFTSWLDSTPRLASGSLRVLEMRTTRTELHGTHQSLTFAEHAYSGRGWSASFDVASECWGYVTSRTVEWIIAAMELVRGPENKLLDACLHVPEGAVPLREANVRTGLRDVPEALPLVRRALERGLLRVA